MKNVGIPSLSWALLGVPRPEASQNRLSRGLAKSLLGVVCLGLFLAASPAAAGTEILEDVGILSVSHRGGSQEAPENTLAAFQNAIAHGANYVECDLRLTGDSVVVCFHDRDVSRTTDGEGLLAEMTLAEVKELDAGSHFDAAFAGETVPTLEEALLLVAEEEGVAIMIDPKYPHWAEDIVPVFENTALPVDKIAVWVDSTWWADDIDTLIPGITVLVRLPSNSTVESTMEWIEDSDNLALASAVVIQSTLLQTEDFETIEAMVHLLGVQGIPVVSGVGNLSSQWNAALDLGMLGILTQYPAGLQNYFADFECGNGLDDDLDNAVDYPADLECNSARDDSENAVCSDGLDNDRDGLVDFPDDPGCGSAGDPTETDPGTECDDGLDNDSDLWADSWDEDCESPLDDTEAVPEPTAGLAAMVTLLCLGWIRQKRA